MHELEEAHTPESILEYFDISKEALTRLGHSLLESIKTNETEFSDRFFGMTPAEIRAELRKSSKELEREVTLALTASFEAMIRIDYMSRSKGKKKDAISVAYRELWSKHNRNARLEDILDTWKEEACEAHKVGKLKQLLQYRHWLAHGRYWDEVQPIFDPLSALLVAQEISQSDKRIPDLSS